MSRPRGTFQARTALASLLATAAVLGGLLTGIPAGATPDDGGLTRLGEATARSGRYVVVLRQPAAAQYDGGIAGLARTDARGGRFNAGSEAVEAYTDHLRSAHRRIADQVGARVGLDYTVALNGFAAHLTSDQVLQLSRDRRVLHIGMDERVTAETWNTPRFLGLAGRRGVWRQHGGRRNAGDGVVVGVIDSGIWPESESFAGGRLTSAPKTRWDIYRAGHRTFMDKADGTRFAGVCQTGEQFVVHDCNTKVIGARYYPDYYLGLPEGERPATEYASARDGHGHGSHTAGTAAGNAGVRARVEGRDFGRLSGMAPAARIAVYKVVWSANDPALSGGATSSVLAAIDDATADGVDVINYSLGGADGADDAEADVLDPTLLAFEGAAEAGVFVATSAGNSGPAAETVAKPAPWVTTVAASTHVSFENTIRLGNGKRIVGASINDRPLPPKPLVSSADIAAAGADLHEATLCGPGTLDSAKAAGSVVVCTRGVYGRMAKSAEVARAGGLGMVLVNPSQDSLEADFHSVPTVHLDTGDAAALRRYLDAAGSNATASFALGNQTDDVTPHPRIAGFSSRGPSIANDADIVKPDIAAPGVEVLAAVAPPSNLDRRFDLYSGTSMASAHVAGLAALVAGHRPRWTPMQIKSAMMTTARRLLTPHGRRMKDPFAQGSGNVRPSRILDPGLFVTSTPHEWVGLMAHEGFDSGSPATPPRQVAPKDVNQPSMAQGQVAGTAVFTRRFTAAKPGAWRVTVKVPGFAATTNRNRLLSRRRGDIEELTFRFSRTDAPLGEFAKGVVRLSGPTTVRLPVALRPVAVRAPAEVAGAGTTGSAAVSVAAGFTGDLAVEEHGLAEADTSADTVAEGDQHFYCVRTTATTKALRVELDAVDDTADLDLYGFLLEGDCDSDAVAELGESATAAADEELTVADPAEGSYLIEVDGFAGGRDDEAVDYVLAVYDVNDATNAGGFHVDPDPLPVVAGQETSFDAVWSGLDGGSRYLGVLEFEGATSPTYVSVDTRDVG